MWLLHESMSTIDLLSKYLDKEAATKRDVHGNKISEQIVLMDENETTCLDFFLDSLHRAPDVETWSAKIMQNYEEDEILSELMYMRDHMLPYLANDLDPKFAEVVATMKKAVDMALAGDDEDIEAVDAPELWYDFVCAVKAYVFRLIA
jgi:maltose-binding protein MalE